MKPYNIILIGIILILSTSVSANAKSYRAASNLPAIRGMYTHWGDITTSKSGGQYADIPMPVYKKTGSNYYIGYRGCANKWIITRIDGAPTPDTIGGGPNTGIHIVNETDSQGPPRTGWRITHYPGVSDPDSIAFQLEVIPAYDLTTNTVGSGTLSRRPAGTTHDENTVVTLTANAAEGWKFSRWTGALRGTANPATITMDNDKTVTATFVRIANYDLSVSTGGSGEVTLDPPGGTYEEGTTVTVTAQPETNWTFSAWSGALRGSANPTTITMDADKSIRATFVEKADYDLSVTTDGSGNVTLDPPGGTYYEGTTVTVTAQPETDWTFNGWSGDLSGSDLSTSITMDADKSIRATFVEDTRYNLSVNTVGSGDVTLDPPGGSYYEGTTVTITAQPAAYWTFGTWSGDLTGSDSPTTIVMDGDKTITATFNTEDSDGDGVSDQDEDAGAHQGDGNRDGTPDRLQKHVVCLRTHSQQHLVTLESAEGTTLSNAKAIANPHPDDCPDWAVFPYDFFQFTITGIAGSGEATTLTLYLPDTPDIADANSYYKYGPRPEDPTHQWYRFKYENTTQVGAQFDGSTITLHYIDGASGDDDLTANSTIEDVSGPAVLTDSGNEPSDEPSPPTPSGNGASGGAGGGCFIQTAD